MRVFSFKPLTVGAVLLLAACQQPPLPEDHFYRMTPLTPVAGANVALNGTVEVPRFVADGLAAHRPIIFSNASGSNRLQAYHYHFWSEPPAIMLQNALSNYLRKSNIAKSVLTPELRVEPEFVATGKIIRFEQISTRPAKIAVELELGVKETGGDKLVHFSRYTVETETANPTVGAAVQQISKAVNDIFARFVADIRRTR